MLVYGGGGKSTSSASRDTTIAEYSVIAVGSMFGWRISQQVGARVSVVCRSNFERVERAGYTFQTSTWGPGAFRPHQVFRSGIVGRDVRHRAYDYVVCAAKFDRQCKSTIQDLRSVVGPSTTLVSAQNGMDVESPLRQAFPSNTILSAICNIGCSQDTPGHVKQTAQIRPEAFLIGIHSACSQGGRIDELRRDKLVSLDYAFAGTDAVVQERWRKLVWNSAWNSMCALTGLDTHQILVEPNALKFVQHLAREACVVADASGYTMDSRFSTKVVDLVRANSAIVPSTLQDARNRRPMELEPIIGYVVSQAGRVGVSVPYTTMVYQLLQERNLVFRGLRKGHESPSVPLDLLYSQEQRAQPMELVC